MKRSTVSRRTWIYLCAVLPFAVVVVTYACAQTIAKRHIPAKIDGTAEQSQVDPGAISIHNAFAQPSSDSSAADSRGSMSVQDESNALPQLPINDLILKIINRMPQGGDYRASSESIQKLESAIKKDGNNLNVDAAVAKPSFCSSATYLVFVLALEELNRRGQIQFEPGVADKLLVSGQHDGVGVWGRWNANGPGTARLFEEAHLGINFKSIELAEPGDFLKIFWNDQIGPKEFGHSVVYLGHHLNSEGIDMVQYWSSNKKGGYGCTEVSKSKIKRMIFSRLTNPEHINQIQDLGTEEYLASMLEKSSTSEEMNAKVGIHEPDKQDPSSAEPRKKEPNPERRMPKSP